ncbi:hypothetical protein [Rufibacter latericius]|uniref:Uncharacterized protein n=1 Tax=Rufibacter latericius TaxID=2487040 RepID=A0A3M9MW16_9BACT|nr:hypothetical protein [Rufibacter latericius]RNI29093.1 hypothetical protein EFB08_06585 [Rufibacter latericius]
MKTQITQPRTLVTPFKKSTPVVSKESQQVKALQKLVAEQNAKIAQMEAKEAERKAAQIASATNTLIQLIQFDIDQMVKNGTLTVEKAEEVTQKLGTLDIEGLKAQYDSITAFRNLQDRLKEYKFSLKVKRAQVVEKRIHAFLPQLADIPAGLLSLPRKAIETGF